MVAQVEGKPKTTAIPAVENKEEKKEPTPTPLIIKPESNPSLTNTNKENISGIKITAPTVKNPNKEFSMIDNSTLINPSTIFEKKWEKEKKDKEIKPEYMSDQFLGDYKSNSTVANIICRDHEFPDGDRVRVFVNDDVFIADLLLTEGYKSFNVPLQSGINKIVFQALNQGESGPNTAEFQVYDDNDVLISAKEWNLLTGVKATIIIVKE